MTLNQFIVTQPSNQTFGSEVRSAESMKNNEDVKEVLNDEERKQVVGKKTSDDKPDQAQLTSVNHIFSLQEENILIQIRSVDTTPFVSPA